MRHWLGIFYVETDQLLDLARAAERLGFEGMSLADHIVIPVDHAALHPSGRNPHTPDSPYLDVWTQMAAMAAVTERLCFMSFVYVLPLREPFSVAKQVATVAAFSHNRVRMGAGVGWLHDEFAILGQDFATRGRRADEMIEILRGFWENSRYEFHGEFFDFPPAGMHPRPSERVPIWIGGGSDAAYRRAAQNDGFLSIGHALEDVDPLLARIREARKREADRSARAPREDFEILITPRFELTSGLADDLTERGITSLLALPWSTNDPDFQSLDAKIDAMERYSEAYIRPARG